MVAPIDPATAAELAARAAHVVVTAPSAIPGVGELAGFVDGLTAARRWLSDRHNWIRIVWVVGGFSLMVSGAVLIARGPLEARFTRLTGEVAAGAAGKAV